MSSMTSCKILYFTASFCKPCQAIAPMVERIQQEHEGVMAVFDVGTDEGSAEAGIYGVLHIPTFILLGSCGTEVERMSGSGAETISKLREWARLTRDQTLPS